MSNANVSLIIERVKKSISAIAEITDYSIDAPDVKWLAAVLSNGKKIRLVFTDNFKGVKWSVYVYDANGANLAMRSGFNESDVPFIVLELISQYGN